MTNTIPSLRKVGGRIDYGFIAIFYVLPVVLVVAFLTWVDITAVQRTPEAIFVQKYAAAGKCLHGTPYDPEKGAFMTKLDDPSYPYMVFAVIPKDANFEKPSILFFSVFTRDGIPGPDLYGGDSAVTAFMYDTCHVDLR